MTLLMRSGHSIPIIGIGTYQCKAEETESVIMSALDAGYRHIDTAFSYYNEEVIGTTIKKWIEEGNGSRDQLFITTKLPAFGMKSESVERYLNKSLSRLQLDYVDLYLIHMPFGLVPDHKDEAPLLHANGSYKIDFNTDLLQIWEELEKQVEMGKVRSIGVSNFNVNQIVRIIAASRIKPSNVQVEIHAYHQQTEMRLACKKLNIPITAHSPLGTPGTKELMVNKYHIRPEKYPDLLHDPLVMDIATLYNKTSAQILLKHLVQNSIIVIPKSTNPEHIIQNSQIMDFDLNEDHMASLNALDKGDAGRIMDFLFINKIQRHQEYPFRETLRTPDGHDDSNAGFLA